MKTIGNFGGMRAIAGLWLAGSVALSASAAGGRFFPFLSPREALKQFQLEPGLRIELVAAEPLIVSPVAFTFDEAGRLYVVEGRGYPDVKGKTSAGGTIVLLTDTNHDGIYNHRTVFASGLGFANGIMAWRGGVFVTCAPDIYYLKDTDGDGVADVRRVVLTGFDVSKSDQLRVSHPTLGLDGKIYVTSGLTGGIVSSPEHPERAPVTSSDDGRFDPETLVFEAIGGRGQFGLSFDDFGRRFICSNRNAAMHVVLEPAQLRRNPLLTFAQTVQQVARAEYDGKVFPISSGAVTADFIPGLMAKPHAGTFTSACGVTVFRDTALTPAHYGNLFICEPAQNLVQRQVLRPAGVSFRGELAQAGREFLASTDVWFRPVFLSDGPDGALYVADMHRREIDHPDYLPVELREKFDYNAGRDSGRIYRIVRDDAGRTPTAPLAVTDPLLGLASPDGWRRTTSRRLLIEANDPQSRPALERLVRSGRLAASRVEAIWTLHRLGWASAEIVADALRDPDPGVRENAVEIAADLLARRPALVDALLAAANDSDDRVRFVSALALGSVADPRAISALASVCAQSGDDPWVRAAALSGIAGRVPQFVAALRQHPPAADPDAFGAIYHDLGQFLGAANSEAELRQFLCDMIRSPDPRDFAWKMPAVLGLVEGLRDRAVHQHARRETLAFLIGKGGSKDEDARALQAFLDRVAETAEDTREALPRRLAAAALLGAADVDRGERVFGRFLEADNPQALQFAAVQGLGRIGDPGAGDLLVDPRRWKMATPQMREAILAALIASPKLIDRFFAALDQGTIVAADVAPARRFQLQHHPNPSVRDRAIAAFKTLEGGDRMKVYQSYHDVLDLPGDAARGHAVFLRVCSVCHSYAGVGGKVGPELTGIQNQPKEALLLHIIVPNYEVAPEYRAVTVVMRDGRSLVGRIVAETDASMTLRIVFGADETVLRRDVASVATSTLSLMPDGLENSVSRREFADLLEYLKAGQ